MHNDLILTNCSIVLADDVIKGTLRVRGGKIVDIAHGPSSSGMDMEGDFVIPGCVELHTDHLETHVQPRPKVRWNLDAALQAHDGQIATAGITTVFDALRVGMDGDTELVSDDMSEIARTISAATAARRLRSEHFIHLRCEVSMPDAVEHFDEIKDNDRVKLASLMDHAPGQRQFVSLKAYRIYYQGKKKLSDGEFAAFSERRVAQSVTYADKHRKLLAERCHASGISIASHDDATAEHVAEGVGLGISLAEFPTTVLAARLSHEAGMKVLMGAPNIVRGGSHSGNVSAMELLQQGTLDILSSDYIPFSLVQAAFSLFEQGVLELPQAVRLISANPADAAKLHDRGRIEIGRRADLVRVRATTGLPPLIAGVWREGNRIA